MKKYLLKSFALLAMLFSTLTMSAVSYCGETITATDGTTTAVLTCTQPTAGTYVMTVTSAQTGFGGLKAPKNYIKLDDTRQYLSNTNSSAKHTCTWDNQSKTLTIEFRCTNVPVMDTPLYLNFSNQEKEFDVVNGQVFDWPTSCEADEEEPTPDTEESNAIDWTSIGWLGNGSGQSENNDKYKIYHECLKEVVNIQKPSFADEVGIYVVAPNTIESCSVDGAIQGGGMVLYLSSFTAKETEVTINYVGGSCTFLVYYADGTEGGGEGGEDPVDPTPEPEEPEVTDKWANVDWVAASDNKYKVSHECLSQVVSVQQPDWADEAGIYVSVPAGISECSVNGAINGAGMILYLSSFTAKETEVTINYAGGSCTFLVYYADGTEGGNEGGATPTEVYDVNFALASNGSSAEATTGNATAAIDNNIEGTSRWESAQEDPQTWTLDLGQARIFNTLEIVWEGAYGKTFTVSVSDDKETWKPIWTVEGQELAGFPYTQTQKIDKTTARYIQFHGTERGTQYGYSFWEFRVFLLGETTLTTLEATPATQYMHMGEENVITITAKDQIGKVMENAGEVAYTISPVEAGVINDNVFTPSQNGTATIVAAIGDVKSAPFDIITYVSQLASLEAKPTNGLAKVGDGLAINVTAKDQHGQVMADAGEVTYTITPDGAGTITNNIYTPARIGLASIVATIGEVSAPAFEVFAYDGENVALSPDINNSKIVAQSEFAPSGTDAWHAIDGNEGNVWQGSATNGTAGDEAARTYDSWFVVDFGAEYDVNLVSIKFEGACSQEYHVDFSADNATWNVAYNHVGNAGINAHTKLIYGNDLQNSTKVRYARFYSTKAATEWGMKIYEFKVFGTESASLTKTVSASVNDAAMGTATVTQNGEAVTEVTTGSEVTFTAIANEGYTFVNWSDGNTNPSFTTTVDAAMHLTANFRALGTVYCNTPMTVDGHTIYVTMKRSAHETYQLIVRSEENLTNFGGTNFYRSNNIHVKDLRNQGVLSEDKHILTATFTAETAPYMGTPLYVIFEGVGVGEITYSKLDNIEYDVECSEDVTITGLDLNPASVSIMVGGSQTLKAIFTPAHAFGEELEWISSNDTIATVDENGLVTAIAKGEAVITATLVSNPAISATCNVTITPFVAYTFYGQNSDNNVDFAYNLTNNANGTVTIVADVLTSNPGLGNISFSIDNEWKNMTKNADGTYTRTSEKAFSMGQEVACFLYAEYTGGAGRIDFKYIVGSSNERPTAVVESVTLDRTTCDLTPNESVQLLATVNPGYATNKSVTWSSSDNNVATVDANGLVTAKAEGTAIITVTTADGGKTATCTINVIATLTDVTYHASTSVKKDADAYLGINYSITRTSDRTLRYVIKVNNSEYVDLEFNVVVNGNWKRMTYDASTNTYTYTTITTYADGDVVSGFFRQIKYGTEGRWDFNYVVGYTSTTTPRTMVAFNDEDVDLSHLNNGSVYDVILKRNFVMDGDWNTLCLPFALDADQVKEVFGEGTTLVELKRSELISDTEIELKFDTVTAMTAATPYLIKPAQNVDAGVVLEGVVIKLTPNVIKTDDANMIPVLKAQSFTGENNTFYLGANENLYPRPTSREIKAMRAYFQFPNLTAAQASKLRARVVVEENVETALDNVSGQKQENIKVISNGQLIIIHDGGKYNAQGVKISE